MGDVRASKHIYKTASLCSVLHGSALWGGLLCHCLQADGDDLLINLIPLSTKLPTSGSCHQPNSTIHKYCQRSIHDLPILGRAVRLSVGLRRVRVAQSLTNGVSQLA